jgi:hypothetical protein
MSRTLLFAVLICVLTEGCFFKTRSPESPNIGGGCQVDFKFNDRWENVMFNLEGALKCGDANEYLRMIDDQFTYEPTPTLAATYPQSFGSTWTKDQETNFIQSAISGNLFEASLTDSIISGPTEDGDITRLTAHYVIRTVDASGNPAGPVYDDVADFEFRRGSLVTLLLWRDNGSGSLPFGELRGQLGGGN